MGDGIHQPVARQVAFRDQRAQHTSTFGIVEGVAACQHLDSFHRIADQRDSQSLLQLAGCLEERRLRHRRFDHIAHLQKEGFVVGQQGVVLEHRDHLVNATDTAPDMGLAQCVVRCDQAIAAHQPVQQGLHRQRAVADLGVADHNTGLNHVTRRNFVPDQRCHHLQVHARLGELDRLETRLRQALQDRQDAIRQFEVVQSAVAVGQHRPNLAVEHAEHAAVLAALQPGVDVMVQQDRLLAAHALEVRIWDLQFVGQLAPRQRGDAETAAAAGLLDDQPGVAGVVGVVAHQR